MQSQLIRKVIKNFWKILDQSFYSSICGKILEYLRKCSDFLFRTIWFPQTNLVSSPAFPVLTKFYLQLMNTISLLMKGLRKEVFFLISQKRLINFGIRVFFSNQNKMAYLVGQITRYFIWIFKKQEVDTVLPLITTRSQINAAF